MHASKVQDKKPFDDRTRLSLATVTPNPCRVLVMVALTSRIDPVDHLIGNGQCIKYLAMGTSGAFSIIQHRDHGKLIRY